MTSDNIEHDVGPWPAHLRESNYSNGSSTSYGPTYEDYGTIDTVTDHRVRLTDADLDLIASALRARRAMTTGTRRHHIERLLERLGELAPGNPMWRLTSTSQDHSG